VLRLGKRASGVRAAAPLEALQEPQKPQKPHSVISDDTEGRSSPGEWSSEEESHVRTKNQVAQREDAPAKEA